MNPPPSVNILGVPIAALNLPAARDRVLELAGQRVGGYICVTGAHGVIEAQDDPEFRRILCQSTFNTPDGMPNVWMGRHVCGHAAMDRVYGPDLMREVIDHGQGRGVRHFFYGGNVGVADELRDRLLEAFPQAEIVGTYCPPFRPLNSGEETDLIRQIEASDPHLIWIGLSTPKQEKFMAAYQEKLPGRLMLGVGAAFDFHAGLVKSAPPRLQRAGLEWFYRLITEPKRLWPRYSRIVPRFLWGAVCQVLGWKQFPDPSETGSATCSREAPSTKG